MSFRILSLSMALPVALAAALLFVSVDDAQAHGRRPGPHGRRIRGGGGVFVSGGVAIPIRTRRGYHREVVEHVGGYYETRTRKVEVPGRQIGWNMRHEPIYAGTRVEIETYEVWVPRRRIVRRVWVPARPVGVIRVGGRYRLR